MPAAKATQVTMWECPVTKKVFKTERGAQECAKKARAKKAEQARKDRILKKIKDVENERSNYLINNATSFHHLFHLMKEKADEFWGIKFTRIESGRVYLRNDKTYGPTMETRMKIEAEPLSRKTKDYIKTYTNKIGCSIFGSIDNLSIRDLFDSFRDMGVKFHGIHTGSGCGGRWGRYEFNMDVRININEYPLIFEQYEKWRAIDEAHKAWVNRDQEYSGLGSRFAATTAEYEQQYHIVKQLKDQLSNQELILSQIRAHGEELFRTVTEGERGSPPPDPENLRSLFEPGVLDIR